MDSRYIIARSEAYLSERLGDGAPFIILTGQNRVMFSAPHSVAQWRHNRVKIAEPYTGVMAELLHDKCGSHAIIKTRNLNDDANYDASNAYRDALVSYIRTHSIRLLVDLHIMRPTYYNTVEMATGDGENVQYRESLMAQIVNIFSEHSVDKVANNHHFFAKNPNCIAATVATQCQIPAIQMELNWADLNLENPENRHINIMESLQDIAQLENV